MTATKAEVPRKQGECHCWGSEDSGDVCNHRQGIMDQGLREGEQALPPGRGRARWGCGAPGAPAGVPGLSAAGTSAVGTSTLPGAPPVTAGSTRMLSGSLARGAPRQGPGGTCPHVQRSFPLSGPLLGG